MLNIVIQFLTNNPISKIMKDQIEIYRKSVEILALTESNLIFKNSNPIHANIVLTNIVKNSNEKILIYDDDLSGDIANVDLQFITEITEYVKNKNGVLKICVKGLCEKNKFQDQIISLANDYPEKVYIKLANPEFRENIIKEFNSDLNFAVGDEQMFRLEYGNTLLEERKAFCSFNNEEYPLKVDNFFAKHYENLKSL